MLQAFARRRSLLGATASTARGFAHIGAAAYQSAVRLAFRLAEEAEASGRPLSELLPAVPAGAERVAVAMSGGVDSSVAALIMRCAGLDVLGLHMNNWNVTEESDAELGTSSCTAERDFADVRAVCRQLGIADAATRQVSFEREYWMDVFEPSMGTLADGLTPNPDWLCNRHVKFGALCEVVLGADGAGGYSAPLADWLCTGHYAQLERGGRPAGVGGEGSGGDAAAAATSPLPSLVAGVDGTKDQSYFLCGVRREALSRVLLPLGSLHKSEVRRLAQAAGLATAHKSDSMGICFVGKRHFGAFINQYVAPRRGPMLNLVAGAPLVTTNARFASRVQQQLVPVHDPADPGGEAALPIKPGEAPCPSTWHHDGIAQYTLGQRARLPGMSSKWFVASKCLHCAELAALVDGAGAGVGDGGGGSGGAGTNGDDGDAAAGIVDGAAVFAVDGTRHAALFTDSAQVWAEDFNWLAGDGRGGGAWGAGGVQRCRARLRHQGALVGCSVQLVPASAVPWLRPKLGDGRPGCGCCADVCRSVETVGHASAALVGLSFGLADAVVLERPPRGKSGAGAMHAWRQQRQLQQLKHCEAIEKAAAAAIAAQDAPLHTVPEPPIAFAEEEEGGGAGEKQPQGAVLFVQFDEPQRGVAPAQILALYEEGAGADGAEDAALCIGGGAVAARGPSYHTLCKPLPPHLL
jgi:tRNA U34 2-thiouridine synthase MnmA/TrmU